VFILKKIFSRTSWPISIKIVQIKDQILCKGKIITKMQKWDGLKIFFSRTTEPEELIFTKF
jgi:hypothetical protein